MATSLSAHRASLACFSNAERFIGDARALIRRGSYGHAIAFLVLAEEEMGKGLLLGLRAFGISIDDHILTRHPAKQFVKVLFLDLMDLMVFPLLEGVKKVSQYPEAKQAEAGKRLMVRIGKRLGKDLPEGLLRDFARLATLDARKQAGLYVDVGPDGSFTTPSDFAKEEAQEYLRLVAKRYRRFLRLFSLAPDMTEEELQALHDEWAAKPLFKEAMDKLSPLLGAVSKGGFEGALSHLSQPQSQRPQEPLGPGEIGARDEAA